MMVWPKTIKRQQGVGNDPTPACSAFGKKLQIFSLGLLGSQRRGLRLWGWAIAGALWFTPLAVLPASQAAELSEIQERGYLIVGVKENLPPLGFRDPSGQLVGFEIELARQIAQVLLGSPDAVVFQPLTNQERLRAVVEDQVDLVIAHLTATEARARVVAFSAPYYLDGTTFITRDPAVQTFTDLSQATIAVLNGSSTIAVVRSQLPQARLVGVESYQQAKELLDAGQIQAFAADASILTGIAQQDSRYRVLPSLLSTEALAVALPKGLQYDDLRQQVDQAIAQWQQGGVLHNRAIDWRLPEAGIPE
jgi:polar amino acid transport system substrate-binding protein